MPDSPGPGRIAAPALLVLSTVLGVTAWLMIRQGTYVLHDIPWDCDSEGCATDDARMIFLVGGAFAACGLTGTAWAIMRMMGFGIALTTGAFAAVSGWHAAAAEGLQPPTAYATPITICTIAGWVGVAGTALALCYELKTIGIIPRLLGTPYAPARLSKYETVDEVGTAVLTFTDRDGFTHSSRIPAARSWLDLPVHAVYERDDPAHPRLALPLYRPVRGDGTGEDDTVVDKLERVATLYNKGHLSDIEYERAKARILESS
ncbi:hypothetical protein GFY24_30935 [Nocardia sp. SYP-A9097]|uniref:SHOCT domain-containing protein n=1 Tax=Nocardia sp. SYP-A9097 TaxID=2663237 RepID=UPI00129BA17E|nr:SHOCT domain-containing protein [Nocardia sp. SYP-A9097]MRH91803.1 hypothetical protein [Nocardia sp. SYP-A9097]